MRKTSQRHKIPSRPSLPSGPSQEASQGPTGSKRVLGPQQSPKDPGSRSTLARAAQVSGSGGPCLGSPAAVLGSFPKDTLSRRRAARPRRYASQPASPTSRPATPTSPWPPGSAGSFSVHQCHTVTSPLRASPQCHSDIRPFRAPLHRHPPPSHPLRAPRSVTPTLFPGRRPQGLLISAGKGQSRLPDFRPEAGRSPCGEFRPQPVPARRRAAIVLSCVTPAFFPCPPSPSRCRPRGFRPSSWGPQGCGALAFCRAAGASFGRGLALA